MNPIPGMPSTSKVSKKKNLAMSGTIGEIAPLDHRLAYTLLRGNLVNPGGCIETGGWEIVNLTAVASDTAANKIITSNLNRLIEADLWVRRVTYTIQRPNFALGNPLKPFFDYFKKLSPEVNLEFIIESYVRYLISPDFTTPLENIESVFECVCPAGLILRCTNTMRANFMSLIALDPTEIPTNYVLTLHATRIPNGIYGSCSDQQAIRFLQDAGYCCDNDCGSEEGP